MVSDISVNDDQVHKVAKEEVDIVSAGEPVEMNHLKRKRPHRHTPLQIQAMEEFFRDCPQPDNQQRIRLSQDIGINSCQVKFWFQNKRTQMKKQHEHKENTYLRFKNTKLRAESVRLKEALSNRGTCPACGRMASIEDLEERYLRMENARLILEINHISRVAANYVGRPLTNPPATPFSFVLPASNFATCPMFIGPLMRGYKRI